MTREFANVLSGKLALTEKAYATFRVEQDRRYESDFDRVVKKPAQTESETQKEEARCLT